MCVRGYFWAGAGGFILGLCLCCEWPFSFCFQSCDLWSLGVIIYVMLCGYPPFYSKHHSRTIPKDMRRKIMTGSFEFPEEEWSQISEMAKDVVRKWVPGPLGGEAKEALSWWSTRVCWVEKSHLFLSMLLPILASQTSYSWNLRWEFSVSTPWWNWSFASSCCIPRICSQGYKPRSLGSQCLCEH